MQWIVCLLHQNELPFRHLFEKIDGKAVGPETFTGPVGKLISGKDGLILKPLEESISFEPVSGKVPIIDYELENNDLKYLYKICHLIQKGPKEGDLSPPQPCSWSSIIPWIREGSWGQFNPNTSQQLI